MSATDFEMQARLADVRKLLRDDDKWRERFPALTRALGIDPARVDPMDTHGDQVWLTARRDLRFDDPSRSRRERAAISIPARSPIIRFLWMCAGADVGLLAQCPSDHSKVASIGATILFTALFACLSGTYALHAVFHSTLVAIPLGIVWGAAILNLDRTIVASMRKQDRLGPELAVAVPRLLVAFVISVTVAAPLELRLFEHDIETRYVDHQRAEFERFDRELDGSALHQRFATTEQRVEKLQKAIRGLDQQAEQLVASRGEALRSVEDARAATLEQRRRAEQGLEAKRAAVHQTELDMKKEEEGALRSGRPGRGRSYRILKQQRTTQRAIVEDAEKTLDALKTDQGTLEKQRDELLAPDQNLGDRRSTLTDELAQARTRREKLRTTLEDARTAKRQGANDDPATASLLTRLRILGEITAHDRTAEWVVFFISLIFIAVEIAPVLVKLLAPRGIYDAALAAHEQVASIDHDIDALRAQQRYRAVWEEIQRARPNIAPRRLPSWSPASTEAARHEESPL